MGKENVLREIVGLRDGPKSLSWPQIAITMNDKYGLELGGDAYRKRYETRPDGLSGGGASGQDDDDDVSQDACDAITNNRKVIEDLSLKDLFDGYKQTRNFRKNFDVGQITADVSIKTNHPIALSFISDVHLGSPHTDYESLEKDIDLVGSTDDMYVAMGGDWADKFMPQFKDKSAPMSQLHPALLQMLTVEKIVEFLGPKILAAIGGNHDFMDLKQTGIDTNHFIFRDTPFPYMPYGGLLSLTVGETTYKILWKHHWRFNSSLNRFNTHHRMMQMLVPQSDIVVTEHEHSPGIESLEEGEYEARRTVVNIRTGSYKTTDPYSMNYFKAGRVAPQTVILWPDKRKVLALHGQDALNDAKTYLRGLGYAKEKK